MCFYNFDYFDTLNPLIMYQLGGTKNNIILSMSRETDADDAAMVSGTQRVFASSSLYVKTVGGAEGTA